MTGSVLQHWSKQARTIHKERLSTFSFLLQVDARQCPTPRSGSWPRSFQGHIETLLREGSKSCVPLAIPSDVWSDLLDSDIPETGTQAFIAALTDEQRVHHQQLQTDTDEERLNCQTTLREQTITNRKAHQLETRISVVG